MSLKAAAQHLAAHGRNGDTTLVHMTPDEVRGLQQLAKQHGTSLTINPHTGMPEAFSLGSFLKAAAPIALGAYLGPAGAGLMTAGEAGLAVGAGTSLLTGSLEKGIQAGLGAYGGAGLGEAAAKGVDSAARLSDANLAATANEIGAAEAAKIAPTPLTTGEAFKAGAQGISSLGAKDLAKYGLAAAYPALAEASKRDIPGAGAVQQGYIRPKYYDYRTQTYYDLPAVKASDWGGQSIGEYRKSMVAEPKYADGGLMGQSPLVDEQELQYQNNPVVRMADGGVTDAQIQEYVSAHMDDPAAIASAAQQYGVSAADLSRATGYSPEQVGSYFSNAGVDFGGSGSGGNGISAAAPSYTSYTPEQMGNYFASNPNVSVADAVKQFNADPNAVNQFIVSQIGQYKDPTATQRGTGYLGAYQNLLKENMSPEEFAAAASGMNKEWGTGYWNQGTVSHAYDVADKILQFDPQTDKVTPSDKEWAAFMDTNKISVKDISLATGLTEAEVQKRYDAAKEKPVVKITSGTTGGTTSGTTTPSGGTTDTYTGTYTTTPRVYAPEGTTNPYGNPINPGDITINPDGSRTVTPNIPGRPYGGFTGIGQVRDAYTAGGGSLGQILTPSKSYQNTGASADAYRYLFGEGAWPTPSTSKPGPLNTVGNTANKYIWKDGMLVLNPDYVDPALAQAKANAGPIGKAVLENTGAANGGLMAAYAHGGETHLGDYSDGGRLLRGPGDGVSDSIPATIGGKQPARLADGEFVVPARIVSELGNGSTEAGARKLYDMMDRVQKARGKTVGKGKVAKNTRADKYLPG